MISNVKVAAVQMSCSDDREENIAKAERMVRQAASDGANVILLPELFELPYFCQEKNYDYYYLADKTEENPCRKAFYADRKGNRYGYPRQLLRKARKRIFQYDSYDRL